VVWGCDHFLKVFTKERFVLDHTIFRQFLLGPMLEAFNNSKLYEDAGPENCRIGNRLIEFFAGFSEIGEDKFLGRFLAAIFAIPWGPVPLFYLTRATFLSSGRGQEPMLYIFLRLFLNKL
jgi:hypothetical protein